MAPGLGTNIQFQSLGNFNISAALVCTDFPPQKCAVLVLQLLQMEDQREQRKVVPLEEEGTSAHL